MLVAVTNQHNAECCLHIHSAAGSVDTAPGAVWVQLHPTACPHAHSHNAHLPCHYCFLKYNPVCMTWRKEFLGEQVEKKSEVESQHFSLEEEKAAGTEQEDHTM